MRDPSPPPLDYASPRPGEASPPVWRRLVPSPAALVVVVLLCLLTLGLAIFPPPQAHRTPARLIVCRSNLRQIYTAMQLYADGNRGALPPNFGAALGTSNLYGYPNVFICPGSADTPATGPTTRAVALDLAKPGHCSYVLASPLPAKAKHLTRDYVLAYESAKNHRTRQAGSRGQVLFGDGHIELLPQAEMDRIVAELKAGSNPPRKDQ